MMIMQQLATATRVGSPEPGEMKSSGGQCKNRTIYNTAQKLLLETSLRAAPPNRPAGINWQGPSPPRPSVPT